MVCMNVYLKRISCVLAGIIIAVCTIDEIHGNVEYCERDVFEPACPVDQVIMMKSALYGRMAIGKCIRQDFGYIGCKADVLNIMDGFCSGRQSCSIKPTHDILIEAKAKVCPSDVAAYLTAEYTCIKVKTGSSEICRSQSFVSLEDDSGNISISGTQGIVGTDRCPWRISLSSGRKINITMLNFPPTPTTGGPAPSSACYEVGSVKEKGKTKTIHKCINDVRQKQIYFSNGGPVDIIIPNRETLDVSGYFILQYHAIGCGDPKITSNAHLQRNKDTITIQCKTTNQKWEIVCKEGKWIGDTGKCDEEESGWSFLGLFDHEHPYGTAIVVGIGATLGVLIGGILLYIIIAIFKRCQKSDYVMTYEYTDPNFAHIPTDYHADKSNLLIQDDKLFEQNSNTWGSQRHGNSNTLSRGGTDHSRVPLPPLPNECNTLSYEKPLYNRNGNV